MSEFLATAFVQIRPQIRGFKTALAADIKANLGNLQSVPVSVIPKVAKNFQILIREQLALQAVPIPVIPVIDVAKFRAEIQAAVLEATLGVEAVIPVKAGAVTGAGAGAGAATAANEEAAAVTKLTVAEQRLFEQEIALTRIKEASVVATELVNKALAKGATVTERDSLLKRANRTLTESQARAEILLAAAITDKNKALTASVGQAILLGASNKTKIGELSKEAELELAVSKAREKANIALGKSETLGITSSALRKQDNALKAVEVQLEKATDLAKRSGIVTRGKEIAGIEAEIVARRALIETQLAGLGTAKADASRQAFAKKGAFATIASLFGVRGATLAANSAFIAGAVAVTVFAKAVQSAAALEQELNVFRVTADATADEMERVAATAKELGADITLPAVSAQDAAAAFTDLAKAGLSVQDSVDGARGVLQLATAAQIGNAEATELVASALNAFGLAGIEATHVADLLTGAANEAQGSISDMGIALQQSSAVARQAGLSLEDTVAFVTLLARNGIRGSDAGTSLRTSLLRLIAPTNEANKRLRELGITVLDMEGNVRPEVFAELAVALAKLDATVRNQTLRKIFGQDAIRAAVIFGREGEAGLNRVREATNQSGLAAELAGARTQGFSGQIEGLKNNLATLGTTLGTLTLGPLSIFLETLNESLSVINETAAAIEKLAGKVSDIKVPPIEIDIGPIEAKKEGTTAGTIFGKAFDVARAAVKQTAIQRVPGLEQGIQVKQIVADFRLVRGSSKETAKDIDRIFDTLRQSGGGASSINEAALALVDLIKKLESGDEKAQELAESVKTILKNFQETELAPSVQLDIEAFLNTLLAQQQLEGFKAQKPVVTFEARLPASSVFAGDVKAAGDEAVNSFKTSFTNFLPAGEARAQLEEWMGLSTLPAAMEESVREGTRRIKQLFAATAGAQRDILDIELAGGGPQQELAGLRALETIQERAVAEQQARFKAGEIAIESVTKAKEALAETRRKITALEEGIASDAEDAARKITEAKNKADQAVIDAFSVKEEKAGNKVLVAESTKSLRDDINTNKALRAILRKQIQEAGKKIKDLETRRDFVRVTKQKIFRLTLEIKADTKAIADQLAQEAKDRTERIATSINLDIEFFQITENKKGEIRARQRLIAVLEKEQAAIRAQKKKTAANRMRLKELRNEIAAEKKAIKDLKSETEERNDAFRALLFENLQAQQGFAANLLSNIIPTGDLAGTVGGTSGASSVLPASRAPFLGAAKAKTAAAVAEGSGGPTRGGQSRELQLLEEIRRILKAIHGGTGFPEAKYERQRGGATMDVAAQ